jgi:2'-5' RNA ligase
MENAAGGEPHALWLLPPSALAARLRSLIDGLASELAGPPFPPHVTLLGRVNLAAEEARRRAATLASELPPLTLRAKGFGLLDEYYRALFLPIAAPPALWRAYLRANTLFGIPDAEVAPFLPHLSLAYTDAPWPARLAAARRLTEGLSVAGEGEAGSGAPDVHFNVAHLTVIHAAGGPGDWVEVERFPVRG